MTETAQATEQRNELFSVSDADLAQMAAADNERIATEMRETHSVVAFSMHSLGVYRKFDEGQQVQTASLFDAERSVVSARKKRFNTRMPEIRKITRLMNQAYSEWWSRTLPYPEEGRRLIPNEKVEAFKARMTEYQAAIRVAEQELNEARERLLDEARAAMGKLFNAADYPNDFRGCWGLDYEFPNVTPNPRLHAISPELYRREVERVRGRFEAAVSKAEQEFVKVFADMVERLAERMKPKADGSRKVFRASSLENLQDFFERFRQLNLGSNAALDNAVNMAQDVLKGVTVETLKTSESTRERIAKAMDDLTERLTGMMTDAPKRKILFEEDDA